MPFDKRYEQIFENNQYFIQPKSSISDVNYYSSIKIRIKSDDDLPLENKLNVKNRVIFISPIFNNIKCNHYQLGVDLVKCSYKLSLY